MRGMVEYPILTKIMSEGEPGLNQQTEKRTRIIKVLLIVKIK